MRLGINFLQQLWNWKSGTCQQVVGNIAATPCLSAADSAKQSLLLQPWRRATLPPGSHFINLRYTLFVQYINVTSFMKSIYSNVCMCVLRATIHKQK